MKVSSYDRVASMLVALLVLVGVAVLILFGIFLTTRTYPTQTAVPVVLEEVSGRGENAAGVARDLEAPGLDELNEEVEPQLDMSADAISEAVSSQSTALANLEGQLSFSSGGGGLGDSRPVGPPGDGEDVIPRYERWEIQFESSDLPTYARQLDFFKIQLGTLAGGDKVMYASSLSSKPQRSEGSTAKEERLYMTWRDGSFKEADSELLASAGITPGPVVMQFYDPETENLLAYLEKTYAKDRTIGEIRRTYFGVRRKGNEFEFYVLRQEYRSVR
ncbi:hypothetical protein LOC68_28035 [Blastopirellula sp. JC732]|uniref:Uncharacterized protein n=1 Tax=Blastopirellula sediminis TaxID=2894196 RepID=A0A9X1SJQ2_9BACT|nr:hypothetical protein [Blastopirellula sediminis]MCC9604440.1 hypothetical protein [Blastopirellula sediminis]MCC9632261.1 hypothetical protein [Blastopirellula sediminis]